MYLLFVFVFDFRDCLVYVRLPFIPLHRYYQAGMIFNPKVPCVSSCIGIA
jgi:hypothetical protein